MVVTAQDSVKSGAGRGVGVVVAGFEVGLGELEPPVWGVGVGVAGRGTVMFFTVSAERITLLSL